MRKIFDIVSLILAAICGFSWWIFYGKFLEELANSLGSTDSVISSITPNAETLMFLPAFFPMVFLIVFFFIVFVLLLPCTSDLKKVFELSYYVGSFRINLRKSLFSLFIISLLLTIPISALCMLSRYEIYDDGIKIYTALNPKDGEKYVWDDVKMVVVSTHKRRYLYKLTMNDNRSVGLVSSSINICEVLNNVDPYVRSNRDILYRVNLSDKKRKHINKCYGNN